MKIVYRKAASLVLLQHQNFAVITHKQHQEVKHCMLPSVSTRIPPALNSIHNANCQGNRVKPPSATS